MSQIFNKMETKHKEDSSPSLPRSQKGKENTPHAGRKSSAASKPPSAGQSQKGRTSQSAKGPRTVPLEANDTPIMEETEGKKFKGENSPTPTSTPKSKRKGRQGADDKTKTTHTGERYIDGGIHPPSQTSSPSESANSERKQARGARTKHCVPLSSIGPEETADHEPEVSRVQRRNTKASSNSKSTSLDKLPGEKQNKSSNLKSTGKKHQETADEPQKFSSGESLSSLSTSTCLEEIADEEQEVYSASELNMESEARSKFSSPGTSILQNEIRGGEQKLSSESTSKMSNARARGKISSPLTSKSQEESADDKHEVATVSTSTLKKQGTQRRPKLSTHSTSTSLEEIACEKHETSSVPTSTPKRQEKGKHPSTSQSLEKTAEDGCQSQSSSTPQKEEETQVSSTTLKKKGTGTRSKPSSNSTSTSPEKISNEENESLSQLTSTKSKRRESGAKEKLFSPPTSTNHEDIAGEEHKVSSASTSTLKKRGTRGKYELPSPLITETNDQMSNEELEVSSELTSPLNSAAEATGKSSPPTSTIHCHTEGTEHEVSPASTATLKRGETKRKGKSCPLASKSGEETADRELQFPSDCTSTLHEKGGEDKLKHTEIVKQGEGAPEGMSSVPAAEIQEETEREIISPSTLIELKASKETASSTQKPKPSKRKINDSREMKLIKKADKVMDKALIEISANPTRNGNDFFDEEVKLEQKEKLHASSNWQTLCQQIRESLKEGSAWKWKVLNSGSSYDGTKVARADEVDCMFIPKSIPDEWMEIDISGAPPEFCFIKLRDLPISDPKYLAFKELCGDQGMVKSALFRTKAFDLFTKGIAKNRHAKAGQPSATAAAFPVNYYVIPTETQGMLPISLDLVPALHFTTWPEKLKGFLSKLPQEKREDVEKVGFHAVPKQCLDASDYADCLWRLSFSAAEKQMTNFVDGRDRDPSSAVVTTYRKHVMRMVKRILELCKGIDNPKRSRRCPSVQELNKAVTTLREQKSVEIKYFSTFQIRMLFWDYFYVRLPEDVDWERSKWRTRLQETFRNLRKMLTGEKQVEHFFVPGLNTMENVPIEEREFLYIIFYIAEKIF